MMQKISSMKIGSTNSNSTVTCPALLVRAQSPPARNVAEAAELSCLQKSGTCPAFLIFKEQLPVKARKYFTKALKKSFKKLFSASPTIISTPPVRLRRTDNARCRTLKAY
ncbi:MAG: hypothetical protein NTX59_01690 [Elusimicrobia bacterium]|nr:hypothetical protein [Elusimicrobiota bacterium]